MLIVPNSKRFRIGEEVWAIVDRTDNRMIRGNITYIHPTNGWMGVRVKRVTTRSKPQKKGEPFWGYKSRDLEVSYQTSLWFDEAHRGAYEPTEDDRKCWAEAKDYADAG